jgi:hypothetical protein
MCSVLTLLNSAFWPQAARFWALEIADAWRAIAHRVRDHYRPELHYMRGPGPKFREKQLIATTRKGESNISE